MTLLNDGEVREPTIPPGGDSADLDATRAFDSAQQQTIGSSPFGADPAAPAPAPPVYAFAPPPAPAPNSPSSNFDQPLFSSYAQPPVRRPVRIPHFGHLLLLSLLIFVALGIMALVLGLASYFHLFGFQSSAISATNIGFDLSSEAFLYFVTFGFALFVFPMIWNEGYFSGLQWRGEVARSRIWLLAGIASACFGLALLDQFLMPGPSNAPIDKMISSPGAAWLMFAFGVTLAPFFEEMFFRGFLLPALSTAADWIAEKVSARTPVVVGANGRVQWPQAAAVSAAVSLGSVPAVIFLAIYFKGGRLALQILLPYLVVMLLFFTVLALRKSPSRDLARPIGLDREPLWSLPSMVVASGVTSIAFAALHVDQQGHSLGPFLLLIVVSAILCAVRLKTRSLAASTLVHATYNFLIFVLTLAATGGFRHFDKM